MRIAGGDLKGRKIPRKALGVCSRHGVLRATSSKVRESVFNILSGKVEGSVFVDLYAGTGAVGTEAMSRRAARVYFVEADPKRAEAIESLLGGCGCRQRATIARAEAAEFLRRSEREGLRFDIVFLDPPYGSDEMERSLGILGESGVLSDDAVLLAEHSSKITLPEEAGRLIKKKTYRYGDTSLTLYGPRG